jgi:acetyltransferase
MIVIGIGGIYTETLNDTVVVRPPFDAEYVKQCLGRLKMRKILDGVRGKSPVDISAYCRAAAQLSAVSLAFEDQITEIDINPITVMEHGCIGLDALLITKKATATVADKLQKVGQEHV